MSPDYETMVVKVKKHTCGSKSETRCTQCQGRENLKRQTCTGNQAREKLGKPTDAWFVHSPDWPISKVRRVSYGKQTFDNLPATHSLRTVKTRVTAD